MNVQKSKTKQWKKHHFGKNTDKLTEKKGKPKKQIKNQVQTIIYLPLTKQQSNNVVVAF